MDQELFNRFVKCAVDTLKVDGASVVPAARFKEDLDADSLDVVELVMALEEEFGLADGIPEEELAEVTTVGQAFDIVVSKL